MIIEYTSEPFDEKDFKDHLSNTLVEFTSPTCAPCREQFRILQELEKKTTGLEFIKVDATLARDMISTYSLKKVPTLILFQDGQPQARKEGLQSLEALETWLGDLI